MDGHAQAAYEATDHERHGPLPVGLKAVHVGTPYGHAVHAQVEQASAAAVFILANASLARHAEELAKQLRKRHHGLVCRCCFSVKMGGGDGGVLAACDAAAQLGADCVVSMGGGAVQDAAKIVRLWMATENPTLSAASTGALVRAVKQPLHPLAPQIALPSVFAVAELTAMAGMSSVDGRKVSLRHPAMMPTVVVFDPQLTRDCPDWLLFGTALRSVDHCIEAATSSRASDATRTLALKGLQLVSRGLHSMLHDNRDSVTAQTDVYCGGWNGIMAMLNVGYAAGHFLENQFSAFFHVHQGACSALLMAKMLAYHSQQTLQYQHQIQAVLAPHWAPNTHYSGSSGTSGGSTAAAMMVQRLVDAVADRAGIAQSFADVRTVEGADGITHQDIKRFATAVFEEHGPTLNELCPRAISGPQELNKLLLLDLRSGSGGGGTTFGAGQHPHRAMSRTDHLLHCLTPRIASSCSSLMLPTFTETTCLNGGQRYQPTLL